MRETGVQVMQLSLAFNLGINDENIRSSDEPGIQVYSVLRGTGLLASALGARLRQDECQAIVDELLQDAPIPERTRYMALGVCVDPFCEMARPGMMTTRDLRRGEGVAAAGDAPEMPVVYEAEGLDMLDHLQAKAKAFSQRDIARRSRNACNLTVVQTEATSFAMCAQHGKMHLAQERLCMDDAFGRPVQLEMRRRGGGYERLRQLRSSDTLQPYVHKPAFCMLSIANPPPLDWRIGHG
jgi:hypothetical protein